MLSYRARIYAYESSLLHFCRDQTAGQWTTIASIQPSPWTYRCQRYHCCCTSILNLHTLSAMVVMKRLTLLCGHRWKTGQRSSTQTWTSSKLRSQRFRDYRPTWLLRCREGIHSIHESWLAGRIGSRTVDMDVCIPGTLLVRSCVVVLVVGKGARP